MVLIFIALKYYKCAQGYFNNLYEMILPYKSKPPLKRKQNIFWDGLITFYIMRM